MRKFEKSFYWGLVASLLMIGWYCYSLSNSQNFSYSDQVYVWQRVWPEGLEQEIAKKTNKTKGFERAVILAAEFEYNEKEEEWKVQWFDAPLNYALTHDDVEVSIRISASVAQTLWPESVVRSFLEELEYLPGKLETLQVDYDCPSSKLNDYARLLSVMGVLDVADQIEITCLPDWLKYSDFERLIEQAHSYVMQVHGVLGYGNEGQLCNIREARRIAVQCSKYECPFLIALPTYRHALEFGEENKVLS